MQRETEILKTLLEVSRLISSRTHMTMVVKKLTAHLRKLLKADTCSLLLLDMDRRELAFVESAGLTRWEKENIRFKLGEGVAGWTAQHKEPVLVENVEKDPRFLKVPNQRRHLASMISVPLIIRRRVIGVLTLTTRQAEHRFNQQDLELVMLLSAHISLAIENTRLYEISVMDGLTSVYNRRYLQQRLQQEVSYSRRFHHPLAFVMADIDWFKRINDTYGHQAGDTVLRSVSGMFAASLRDYDVVARYGGEEFGLVLPALEKDAAAAVAERLRAMLTEDPVHYKDLVIPVSASFGVAAFPDDGTTPEDLIRNADEALYRAKHEGRNCVVLA